VIAVAVYGATPVPEGLARIEEIRTRVEGNRRLDIAVLNGLARLQSMRGDFEGARDALRRSTALVEGGSDVTVHSHIAMAAGMIELLADDPVAAERVLGPSCERLEAMGELGYLASAVPPLLEALYRQGRLDEALALAERWRADDLTVPEDVDAQVGWRAIRGKLLAHEGRLGEGEALTREADALCAGTEDLELRAKALADLAEVLRLAARPHEAREALEEALRLHERKGNRPAAERIRRRLDDS
jgi:tetratricopeptide (TPR) repeat protein